MRVPNGGKCQFGGSDCQSEPLPGQAFCAVHIAAGPETARKQESKLPSTSERARRSLAPQPEQEAPVDVAVEGARLSQRLLAEESRLRLEYFKEQQAHPGRRIRQRPLKAFQRPVRKDRTAMVHPETGENLVKPGWAAHWVRKADSQGRPSDERIEEFRAWGYEAVTYRDGDGVERPLEGLYGAAMQAPLEQYAARQAEYTPVGAYNRWDLYGDAEEAMEELNRKVGTRAASFYVDQEHRSRRVEISSGEQVLEEH